jgi:hypothetical protein
LVGNKKFGQMVKNNSGYLTFGQEERTDDIGQSHIKLG